MKGIMNDRVREFAEALIRSDVEQIQGWLASKTGNECGYCCMGFGTIVVAGLQPDNWVEVKNEDPGSLFASGFNRRYPEFQVPRNADSYPPVEFAEWLGLDVNTEEPAAILFLGERDDEHEPDGVNLDLSPRYYGGEELADLNDSHQMTFEEIGRLILKYGLSA